jgi:5-methylthioadenosine/S-adenosylhomocysteine deaminase
VNRSEVIFRGGTIVTVDAAGSIATGDVACRDGIIVQVGGDYMPQSSRYDIIDAAGCIVMPGLVQAHTHVCQTLARGRADDLELLDWLAQRVWPYEASLDADAMTASAELGIAELLLGGTTAMLDMGSVHHTDAIFDAALRSGIRATGGKAMMDAVDPLIPAGLRETTKASLDESAALLQRWHGRDDGRLQYAYAPRFALSCTDELLREVSRQAVAKSVRIHTHGSENHSEIAEVAKRFGKENIAYLDSVGISGAHVSIAHCIHLSQAERALLARSGTHVLHCPSSNLKLASGICEVPELLALGISVGIGADGAPCNNNLDGFLELRLAALLQKPRLGPRTMPASQALRLATMGGAAAMGLADQIGSLELGKRADIIAVSTDELHTLPAVNPYSVIVYATKSSDVRHVVIDGAMVVRDRQLLTLDVSAIKRNAATAARRIFRA